MSNRISLVLYVATLLSCHEKPSYKPLSSKFSYSYQAGGHAPRLILVALVDGRYVEIANGVTESADNQPAVVLPGQNDCLIYSFSESLYIYKIGNSSPQMLDKPVVEYRSGRDGITYKKNGPLEKRITWEELQNKISPKD